jgi:pyruvate kinase
MVRIVRQVEGSAYYRQNIEPPVVELAVSANAIAHAAVIAARKMKVRTIAVVTGSGGAARLMSEYRPEAEIVALTTDEVQFRRLALVWGVTPVHIPHSATTDEVIDQVEATLLSRHLAVAGEHVIITMGVPVGAGVQTNLLKIHQMS